MAEGLGVKCPGESPRRRENEKSVRLGVVKLREPKSVNIRWVWLYLKA